MPLECITLQHLDDTQDVIIVPDIDLGELKAALRKSFMVDSEVVGLEKLSNGKRVFYPLSSLSRDPAFFSGNSIPYHLVLSDNSVSRANASYQDFEDVYDYTEEPTQLPGLSELATATGLISFTPMDVFGFLLELFPNASNDGISRNQFRSFLSEVMVISGNIAAGDRFELANQIFDIFDTEEEEVVQISQIIGGIALLCKGTNSENVRAAFRLFDTDNDGYISLDEMKQYIRSVFLLIYSVSPERVEGVKASAEELANVTAQQCFHDADTNGDGRISFPEFERWYISKESNILSNVSRNTNEIDECEKENFTTLNDVQEMTHLGQHHVHDVFEVFAQETDSHGYISRDAFNTCVDAFVVVKEGENRSVRDRKSLQHLKDKLFRLFDTNDDGVVDFVELCTGLVVLCGGTRAEKADAAFSLYDFNNDGVITLDEMTKYLTSVFRVVFEVDSLAAQSAADISPEVLASATAEQAFADADLNEDGMLTRDEFQIWYTKNADVGEIEQFDDVTMTEVQQITRIGQFSPSELLEIFAIEADKDGWIPYRSFSTSIDVISAFGDTSHTVEEAQRLEYIKECLFDLFDTNDDGVVDFVELSTGLVVLCGGSRDEKADAAFSLYDFNNDGVITLDEMTKYLTSVFRVVFAFDDAVLESAGDISPEELASATAEQAFADADLNEDGMLTRDEFQMWYTKNANDGKTNLTMTEVQRLTRIGQFSPSELLEIFAIEADKDGYISYQSFSTSIDVISSFDNIYLKQQDRVKLENVKQRLFDLFDTNDDGVVDFVELSTGLVVLCGGSKDEKAYAAYKLYDFNNDGVISLKELVMYLTSVFRIVFEVDQDAANRVSGLNASDLAEATAKRAFKDAGLEYTDGMTYIEFAEAIGASVGNIEEDDTYEPLKELANSLGLAHIPVKDIVDFFAYASNSSGQITRDSFEDFFGTVCEELSDIFDFEPLDGYSGLVSCLFEIFDPKSNGFVNYSEICVGLSILCLSTKRLARFKTAFELCDNDGDGFINFFELRFYLVSILRVMYFAETDLQLSLECNPMQIAHASATECFETFASFVDEKRGLSMEAVYVWLTNSLPFMTAFPS